MLKTIHIKVFQLYFLNYTKPKIAKQLGLAETQVMHILNNKGREYVKEHLSQEYKDTLTQAVSQGLNSTEIGELLGWNRWLTLFVIRRLSLQINNPKTSEASLKKHMFRCPICRHEFETTLVAINPDRICPNCVDRRNGDRRNSNRC
jgi:hypothetical protein